ncbi:MAG: hypothetical protein WC858_04690, partial [Parcubacteria group bacterium]
MFSKTNKKIIFFISWAVICIAVFAAFHSRAAINQQINYQGKLTNKSDVAVPDGNYDMVFKIYDGSDVLLWTGTYTAANGIPVAVANGIFSVMLGSGTGNELNLNFDSDTYYLGVTVGTDAEMTPKKRLGAVPQAVNSLNVIGNGFVDIDNTSTAQDAANINYNPTTGANSALSIVYGNSGGSGTALNVTQAGTGYAATFTGGNVGIGTTNPGAALEIGGSGNLRIGGLTASMGVYTDANKQLTSTVPTSGTLGYWTRSGITLWPTTNTDNVTTLGNVGIGTTNPGYKLAINGASGSTSGLQITNLGTANYGIDMTSSGLSGTSDYLLYADANTYLRADGMLNLAAGFHIGEGTWSSDKLLYSYKVWSGTAQDAYGVYGYRYANNVNAPTNKLIGVAGISQAYVLGDGNTWGWTIGVYGRGEGSGGTTPGTVSNAASLYAASGGYSSNLTNRYGLYVENISGGVNNWSIYSSGSAASYFAGSVGIGTTAPGATLDVTGTGRFSSTLTASNGFTLTAGTLSLPASSVTDAMVSDTLTASNLVAASSVVSNAEVDDNLTITGGSIDSTTTIDKDPVITLGTDLTGNVTLSNLASGTLNATIAANSVALTTDTTGNYVAGLTAGTAITITGTAGEAWSPTVAVTADSIGDTQLAFNTGQALTTTSSPTFAGLTLSANLVLGANTLTTTNETVITHLNADLLDGHHSTDFQTALTNPVTGTGTENYVAVWGAGNSLTSQQYLNVAQGGTGAGTFSSNYLLKGNGTSALSSSVIYDDGTNVGIGTTSPTEKLVVSGGNINLSGSYGTEKVANGTFTGDASGWSLGADWVYNSNAVDKTGGGVSNLSQTMIGGTVAGETYKITYTLSNVTAGYVIPWIGGSSAQYRAADGTYTEYITAATTAVFSFNPSSEFRGTIDNVSVVKLTDGIIAVENSLTINNRFAVNGDSVPGSRLSVNGTFSVYAGSTNSFVSMGYQWLTSAGQMTYTVGSSSSHIFKSGTKTTMQLYSDGNVGIGGTAAATSPVMFLAGGGNVGIGTTSPNNKLEVSGGLTATGISINRTDATQGNTLRFANDWRILDMS